jgi:peroxiredoxin
MTRPARIGSRAPAFSLPAVDGTGRERMRISLDDYLDRWLVLLFYSRDFSLI